MKFGIAFANTGPFAARAGAVELAQAAEAAGFESVWTVEHVIVPSGYQSAYPYSPTGKMPGPEESPIPDPLIWLSFVAAATERIRVATGILILPQRNPVVLAKELATLDSMSGGRLDLGIGVGWLAEEFDAIGVPFADRGARTDDHVAALRAVDAGQGDAPQRVHRVRRLHLAPSSRAGHDPDPRRWAHTRRARRAGRLGDGFFPGRGGHDELRDLFDVARAAAADAGRDPDAIELTAAGRGAVGDRALDEVAALAALGVDRVIVPSFLFWKDPAADLARYGEEVIAHVA